MRIKLIGLASLFLLSASVHASSLEQFISPEVRGPGLVSERAVETESSIKTKAHTVYPIGYQYVTANKTSAHVHTYVDCQVITIATGPEKGAQGVYDLSGQFLIASKNHRDGAERFYGISYDLYDYGTGVVLHAGKTQMAYLF